MASKLIMLEQVLESTLFVTAPPAFPRTQGVEGIQPGGLDRYDARCWRKLGKNNCISVVHVICTFRKQLPQEAAAPTASFLGRVQKGLVHCAYEGVPVSWIVAGIFCRDAKFWKHDWHSQEILSIINVRLHPRSCKFNVCFRNWLRNPSAKLKGLVMGLHHMCACVFPIKILTTNLDTCGQKQNQLQELDGYGWNRCQLVDNKYLGYTELCWGWKDRKNLQGQSPPNAWDRCFSHTLPFLQSNSASYE